VGDPNRWRGAAPVAIATLALVTSLAVSAACSDEDSTPGASPSQLSTSSPTSVSPAASPAPSSPAGTNSPTIAVFTNDAGQSAALSIEVADTPGERAIGLMNRESLPEDAGMLFDFGADVQVGFWMRDTLIPLSIAFIDKEGMIVHIEDMEPQTENLHSSPTLYRYAIEVNQGWYTDNGIAAGDTVRVEVEG
jgi:uncharacterized membrane protein (UPF0127 family)